MFFERILHSLTREKAFLAEVVASLKCIGVVGISTRSAPVMAAIRPMQFPFTPPPTARITGVSLRELAREICLKSWRRAKRVAGGVAWRV